MAAAKCLTAAEVAAIATYTGADYKYINPSTADDPEWLKSQATGRDGKGLGWSKLHATAEGRRELREEGSLHAGVAMQGLAKLDPFVGECYRGSPFTESQFQRSIGVGKIEPILNLTSSSKSRKTAAGWADDVDKASGRDISVLSVYSGTGGRDISTLSMVKSEGEVLILPGTKFVVTSVKEVIGGACEYREVTEAIKTSMARKWYIVRFQLAKTSRPWHEGSKASDLPSSAPVDEYLSKGGSPSTAGIGGRTGKGSAPRR